jgi:hypothetical protein
MAPRAFGNIVITPYFDDSVTAAQQAVINQAISFYGASFTDPINVKIEFETKGAGGSSRTTRNLFPMATALNMLQNDSAANPNNTVLANALNFFGVGNSAQQMQMNSANCRAVGGNCAGMLQGEGSVNQADLDGIITVGAGSYGDTATALHEINEVLGIGGWGSIVGDPQIIKGKTTIRMLDPYRYSAKGVPSLTDGEKAYFSLDGGASDIADFNPNSKDGDTGDWTTNPCYVQSYAACDDPAAQTLMSPEGIGLQAIGYDPVPEPGTLMMVGTGVIAVAGVIRRKLL